MTAQQEVIKAFMKSLDTSTSSGVTALDNAVKACSSFGSLQNVINQLIGDCKGAANVESFLKEKYGIVLDNEDTGAITSSDAGGSKTKTAESVVPESGKSSYLLETSFTKRGLTVIVSTKDKLTTQQQTIVSGLYSWWIDSALKLIEESYGFSFTDSDATVKEVTLEFIDDPYSDTMAYVTPGLYTTDGIAYNASKLTLTVNIDRFKNITAKDINGSKETYPFYLDRLLAHELTHAIMAAKINNSQELPNFIIKGMAELTHGADDIRTAEIKTLVSDPSQLENILKGDNFYPYLDYAAGYIFLRYLAKQVSDGNDTIPADENADQFIENTLDDEIIQTQNGNDTINNSGSQVTISSGNGKDIITNYGSNVSINLGKGNDDIYNFGNIVKINGEAGNDSIGNQDSSHVTINGGFGHDYIINNGQGVSISGGAGNDYINNSFFSSNVILDGGAGNDTIENLGMGVTINAGNGNDYVYNNGIAYDINLGEGNDTLFHNGSANLITGGKGDDLIDFDISATNVKFNYAAGDGNDTIFGYNLTDTINLTKGSITGSVISGNDLILKIGTGSIRFVDALTVNVNGTIINPTSNIGTKSKDTINNHDSNVTINGYGGNDKITNFGKNVLINAGAGNNFIENYGKDSIIRTGNGKNTIYSGNSEGLGISSIMSGSGNDSIHVAWVASSIVDAGAGNDTIKNASKSLLKGGKGDDIISNEGDYYATINGGKGNDTIYGHGYLNLGAFVTGDYQTLEYTTGDGKDVVYGYTSNDTIKIIGKYTTSTVGSDILIKVGKGSIRLKDAQNKTLNIFNTKTLSVKGTKRDDNIENIFANATINALGGEDTVKNSGHDVSINGGEGNDYINNKYGTSNVTILGGNGNDEIDTSGDYTTVNAGPGNDSIDNVASKALISGGTGNDYINHDYGCATTLDGGDGNDDIQINGSCSNVTISGGKGNDSIGNVFGTDVSIDGGEGDDRIFNQSQNVTIIGGAGNDYVHDSGVGTAYVYVAGDDTLDGFNNTDTIVLGSVKVNSSVRSDDGTVTLNLSNKRILKLENYGSNEVNIVKSVSDVKRVNIFENNRDSVIVKGTNQNDYINSWGNNVTIEGGKGNDYIQDASSGGTMGIGTAYVYSGGSDTLSYFNELDTIVLGSVKVNSSVRADSTVTLNLSNKKTLTLINYWSDKINLVKSISDVKKTNVIDNNVDSTVVSGTEQNDYINNWGKSVTIEGGKGDDYVYGEWTHLRTVYVYSAGDDTLDNFNDLDTIVLGSLKVNSSVRADSTVTLNLSNKKTLTLKYYGEKKINIVESINAEKNLIQNDKSSVTVKGTKQDDIIYSVGDNMTIDAGAGNDDILIKKYLDETHLWLCNNVSINAGSGNDNIRNLDSTNVTIEGGKGNDYIHSEGKNVTINAGEGNDSINNNGKNSIINCGSGDDSIENWAGGSNVIIDGGAGNDYILNQGGGNKADKLFGGSGNDTLIGGRGNDSLWGDAGADTFIYESGDDKDVIFGFDNKDTLTFDNIEFTTSYSKKNSAVSFKVAGGSVILKDFTASTFHINSDIYKISNNKFVKQK